MKHMKKNKLKRIISILIFCVFFMSVSLSVKAENERIMSAQTDGENIYLYIKGVSEILEGKVQIGSKLCSKDSVHIGDMNNFEHAIRTTILIDNSLSIQNKNREDIQIIINGILDGHMQGELFRIGTISDSVTWMSDVFSSDYTMLHTCVNSLSYNNQDTYFSDCLYNVVEELAKENDGMYSRIIVISDGADDRTIGYTNSEVFALLEKSNIPVYTIGTIGNNSALETMFSFSRVTKAECFLLDDTITNDEIIAEILTDQSMICIKVVPDDVLMDGSQKNIQVSLVTENGEIVVDTAIIMPFGTGSTTETENESENIKDIETEPTVPNIVQENELPSIGSAEEDINEESNHTDHAKLYIIVGISVVIFICLLSAFVLIVKKRREKTTRLSENNKEHKEKDFSSSSIIENETVNPMEQYSKEEETFIMDGSGFHENTMSLWDNAENNRSQAFLVLKDLDRPLTMYKVPIEDSVQVGRKEADIVIDYDKYISSKHCEIIKRGELLYIKDLGSANGTYYENMRVYDQETVIVNGGNIKIGQTRLSVTVTEE